MGAHPAMGRGVGVRRMKKLWEAFCGDMSKCSDFDAIVSVDGFDKKTATKIVSGYPTFLVFLSQIEDYVTLAPYVEKPKGNFTGMSVVFTGFRSKELEQAVEAAGGKISTSVSGKTSLLVTMDPNSSSGRAQKARESGVKLS